MVVSYQLFGRKRKPAPLPALRALAPPPPKPLPLFIRIRKRCTTLFTTIQSKLSGSTPSSDTQGRRHRTLRSFHLPTPFHNSHHRHPRYPRASTDEKTPSSHRPTLSTFFSTHTSSSHPKRAYTRLDDDKDELMGLVRPDPAVLSPWSDSPLEDAYPPTPTSPTPKLRSFLLRGANGGSPPGTHAPLSPLPPAYLNSTPQRPGARPRLDVSAATLSPQGGGGSESTLPSPTLVGDEMDIADGGDVEKETKKLIEEIQQVLEFTRDRATDGAHLGSFVIADEEEDIDDVSIYSNL